MGRRAHRKQSALGASASEAVLRTLSIQFPWLDQPRFLSLRAARANARSSFRAHDPHKVCAYAKIVSGFRKSVPCSIKKLRNHPEPSQRKEERRKHDCHRYQKATVATSQTIDEVFHEAIRSYHNFVFK